MIDIDEIRKKDNIKSGKKLCKHCGGTCDTCGGVIITVDIDDGVTPAFLSCKVTVGCFGTMHSDFYRVQTTMPAEYEWFKPASLKGYSSGMRQHIEMGGLVLRKIELKKGGMR